MQALIIVAMVAAIVALTQAPPPTKAEQLQDAARKGDAAAVTRLLDDGVDVNTKFRYNATALFYACDHGHLDVVKVLLDKGADLTIKDTFYGFTPLMLAVSPAQKKRPEHTEIAKLLIAKGAPGKEDALSGAIESGDAALVKFILDSGGIPAPKLSEALEAAKSREEDRDASHAGEGGRQSTGRIQDGRRAARAICRQVQERREATNWSSSSTARVSRLGPPPRLRPSEPRSRRKTRRRSAPSAWAGCRSYSRSRRTRSPASRSCRLREARSSTRGWRESDDAPQPSDRLRLSRSAAASLSAQHWPAFRGANAAGVADGTPTAVKWNAATGENVAWKTPVPGVAVSSPIVWGDRVFVSTAVSSDPSQGIRTGLYGDVEPVNDSSKHTWRLIAHRQEVREGPLGQGRL